MGPPGLVVAHPYSAVAVHSDIRGAGEHEEALAGIDPLKGLTCRAGHIIPETGCVPCHAGWAFRSPYDKNGGNLPYC